MIEFLALAVVLVVGIYFTVLGIAALFAPAFAKRFLLGFAHSPLKHYGEMLGRLIVGAAFLVHAPRMPFPTAFNAFAWLLIVTSACLLLVPWQWHQRFAQRTVPQAIRYITLIGLCSLVLGGSILVAIVHGPAP